MAEARREEEGAGQRRGLRDVRNRRQATDHPERTKPDHLQSSQGPLSSIRAAIKRTRTDSPSDHTRERRRPEITIVSAEPLDSNNWFSGWSAGIQAVPQPPPSYDQVIQEKTQEEHIVKPTAAPRRTTSTTTTATQTDPVREDASQTAPQTAEKRPADKKPQKPPRPLLPKPVDRVPSTTADKKVGTNTAASTVTEDQSDSKPDVKQPNQVDSTHTCTKSITVHWDIPTKHLSATAAETTPSSSDSEHSQRPVPLPRTKTRKQAPTEEVRVQTLVKLSENCDNVHSDPEDVSSNKYLQELLEVFSADNGCEEGSNIINQSYEALQGEDAGSEMNTNNSQRNIQAKIQAFERQGSTRERNVVEQAKPAPLPRKSTIKPPVAAKPSVALKPQFNHHIEENNQNVLSTNLHQNPAPAPRPQPPSKPVESVKEELETLLNKVAIPNRSRPSVLTRASSFYEKEPSPVPPTPPVNPFKEPLKPNLNINNHNSASMFRENEYLNSPSNHIPVKPQHNVDNNGGSFARQSLTRRPTTIRVPSKTGSLLDNFQDSAPPLPADTPVSYLNTSVSHQQSPTPNFPFQESFQFGPEPSLPPRRQSTSKSLPPRPPPAKTSPGRSPPSVQATSRSHSTSWEASPKPQAQKPHRKGPVLPPRPNPGHRLYNNYTLQLPHGIAAFDYNGSNNTGELSFQKNEVLLLLEEIDHKTFECQVGDTRGSVHKSRMKVITPLTSFSDMSPPQDAGPAGYGLKVQALHDFNPGGPGELGLRAGDVVTMVEQVDNDWYSGSCRGSSGFFPINYVKVMSNSPKPLPERKAKPPPATVSGPRCVARFDFEGEHSDELSFSEGDVIQLKSLVGQDWARGQIGVFTGIFPLNFVEIIEDLPPPPSQQHQSARIALPGMIASPSTHPEVAEPAQSRVEWVVALYDFAGNSDNDLSFQRGDSILITQHVDADWSCGRFSGREGMFPRAFVESSTGQQSSNNQQNVAAAAAAGGGRARAMFNFTSDCEEELSLKIGDIITSLESVDGEWFLGDLRGKRALVPKNYVQVLG